MRRGAADQTGVGFHRAEAEPAAGEDGLVRLIHLPVALLCAGFVGVERVGVLHDELAPPHHPPPPPDLLPAPRPDPLAAPRRLPPRAASPPHHAARPLPLPSPRPT